MCFFFSRFIRNTKPIFVSIFHLVFFFAFARSGEKKEWVRITNKTGPRVWHRQWRKNYWMWWVEEEKCFEYTTKFFFRNYCFCRIEKNKEEERKLINWSFFLADFLLAPKREEVKSFSRTHLRGSSLMGSLTTYKCCWPGFFSWVPR